MIFFTIASLLDGTPPGCVVIRPVSKLSELSTYAQIWKPGPDVD